MSLCKPGPLLLLALLAGAEPVHALDTTWFGGSGGWSAAANWSAGVPGAGDFARLDAGNASLTSDTTIGGLQLNGATISGAGTLTLAAASSWTAGTLTGTGATRFGGTLAITGNTGKGISGGRVIDLLGTTTWSGNTSHNGNALVFNNGTINNSGTFIDANTFNGLMDTLGSTAFNNSGSYRKTGAATTAIEVVFNNTGNLTLDAGRLTLWGGTSTGSVSLAAGSSLAFVFGTHTMNSATVSGAGTLEVAGGTLTLNDGNYSSALLIAGGNLNGSAQAFTGAATWTGGTVTGVGTTRFDGGLTITGNTGKGISGTRVIDLPGATAWNGNTSANGNALVFNNGTINNSGTFTDANGFDTLMDTLGSTAFNNTGTYRKTGNATTSIEVVFNNANVVQLDGGRLTLRGGVSTGHFGLASGSSMAFVFGTHTFNGATVEGAGTLEVAGGTLSVNGGSYSAPLLVSSGNLTGSAATFTGAATWTGGTLTGAGTTRFEGALAITGNTGKGISGTRVVDLAGTTTWGGNTANNGNTLTFGNGTFNNSGTFNDGNAFNALMDTGGATAFNNTGTYNKLGNAVTIIEVPFNNTALVNVPAGTLNIASTFDNLGTITVASGATFGATNLSRDLQNHGVLRGTGTYDPAPGRTLLNNGRIQPGAAGGIGALAVAGNFTQQAAGEIDIELASLALVDVLNVSDNATLGGTIHVVNSGYVPVLGDSFIVLTYGARLAGSTFAGIVAEGFASAVMFEAIYNAQNVTLRVTTVPEASEWALLLAGLLFLIAVSKTSAARAPSRR